MKKLLVCLLILMAGVGLSAQVKNYVGIIQGDISKDVDSKLRETGKALKSGGHDKYSDFISDYLESCYGSGFVFVDKDGSNYIVTNLHVISHATSASIEFRSDEGKTEKYEGLSVVYIDDTVDMALLRFKNNANPFKRGLPLSDSDANDGDDVFTAGFPGLDGEPLWQLGKGNVTNSHAYIDELIKKDISHVIQHSAEIDGGNSGGPLLRKTNNFVGYEVVGINTWKAINRQNTNFAVPASVIKKVIDDSKKPVDNEAMLASRKSEFKHALTVDQSAEKVMKFVSYEAAIAIGEQCFIDALNRGARSNSESFDAIINTFDASPIEGFRLAIAYTIIKDYKKSETVDDDFNWMLEQGVWRIKSPYTNEELQKSLMNYVGKVLNNSIDLRIGTVINFVSKKPNFFIGCDFTMFNKFSTTGFSYEPVKSSSGSNTYNCFGTNVGIRIPIDIAAFKIVPYGKLGLMSMISSDFGKLNSSHNSEDGVFTNFYYDAGLTAGYRVFNFIYAGLSVGYTGLFKEQPEVNYGGLNISASVSFCY